MPFMTLNGHTFPVAIGSANRRPTFKGARSRAYRGQMRDGRRGVRREWRLRACFRDHEEAQTMIHVVNGEGHVVKFVDGWDASTGLNPEVGSLTDVSFNTSAGPFSGFPMGSIGSDGDDLHLRYDAQLCDEWTIHAWYKVGASAWAVITKRSDGAAWVDGTRTDTAWALPIGNFNIDVRDGRVEIGGDGADFTLLHHLVLMPFLADEAFVTSWHASTKPWGALPLLRMEGDLLVTDHEFVFGEVTGVEYISKPSQDQDFGWINNAEIVSFTLSEYATGFVSDPSVPT